MTDNYERCSCGARYKSKCVEESASGSGKMCVGRMINSPPSYTETQRNEIEVKFTSIEERIRLQIENAIIEYFCEQVDTEDRKKKSKPYYRKGRWE